MNAIQVIAAAIGLVGQGLLTWTQFQELARKGEDITKADLNAIIQANIEKLEKLRDNDTDFNPLA